jgi:hypothetical protein
MPQKTSPYIEAKFGWNYGESGWNTGMDENLVKFSYLFNSNINGVTNSLPVPVENGNAYFVTPDNRVYFGVDGVWVSTPVPKWFILKNKNTGEYLQWDGTALTSVMSPTDITSELELIDSTISSLGSAAFEDASAFTSPSYVDGAISELSGLLSAPSGSGLVGFGAGTVNDALTDVGTLSATSGLESRAIAEWLQLFVQKTAGPVYLASAHGVDVTGVTDGATALNNLLSNAPAGSTILIDGVVRTNSPIIIPKEGLTLRGLNRRGCTIRSYGTGPIIRSATQDTQTLKFTVISDLLLLKDASQTGSAFLLDLKSMQFTTCERLWISGASVAGQIGVRMEAQATDAHVEAGTATEGSYNYLRDCTIGGVTDCVSIRNVANSNTLENVRCQPNISGGYGIRLVETDGTYVNNIRIISCSCEFPGKITNGVFVGANVSGVTILGCRFESMNLGVYVDAAAGDVWVPLRGNYFSSCNTNVSNSGQDTYQGVVALLRFTVSGGVITINRQSGIQSVAYTGVGTYTVTYKTNLGADYVPIASSSNPQTELVSLGGTSVQIRTRNSSGALTDAVFVMLMIEK